MIFSSMHSLHSSFDITQFEIVDYRVHINRIDSVFEKITGFSSKIAKKISMKSEVSPISRDGENKVNDTHTAMTNSFGKALSNDSLHDEYKFRSSPSPTLRE